MNNFKSTHIVSELDGVYRVSETDGESCIFDFSEFFVAKDGTWLMVDWMPDFDTWYVTMGA